MVLKKFHFFILTAIWLLGTIAMGIWWLYLLSQTSDLLSELYKFRPDLNAGTNFAKIIVWEGSVFIGLQFIISFLLIFLYMRDRKKTQELQAFFASLTHELKTPLASIRLQAEVLKDESEFQKNHKEFGKLIKNTHALENELDKILHLSRIERSGNLSLRDLKLKDYTAIITSSYPDVNVIIQGKEVHVTAEEYSLKVILKNLIQNSIRHSEKNVEDLQIDIQINHDQEFAHLHFKDNGSGFHGDFSKLGKLFYKHESQKGSGIGLYLCQKLSKSMNGNFEILNDDGLSFKLTLPRGNNE